MLISDKPFDILLNDDVINKMRIYHVSYVICTGLHSYKAMIMLNYVIMTVHNKIGNRFNKEGHLQILPQMFSFEIGANSTVKSLTFFRFTTYSKQGEVIIPLRMPEIMYDGQKEADVCIILFKHYFDRFIEDFLKSDRFVNECASASGLALTKKDFFNLYDCLFNGAAYDDLIGVPLNPFEEAPFSEAVFRCSKANMDFYDVRISKGIRFKSNKEAKTAYDRLYKSVTVLDEMKKAHDGLL